eukprot:4353112-Karenia_brevis.AAC.1
MDDPEGFTQADGVDVGWDVMPSSEEALLEGGSPRDARQVSGANNHRRGWSRRGWRQGEASNPGPPLVPKLSLE